MNPKRVRTLLLSLLLFAGFSRGHAQRPAELIFLDSLSRETLTERYGTVIRNGVRLYKLIYTTTDFRGEPDTASGLLVVPDLMTGPLPLVIYQHGSINLRDSVPSNLSEEAQIPIVYGAVGGLALAPDYLGFGASRGFHPYLHAPTEASVAVDMLLAVRSWTIGEGLLLSGHLFLSGYSQGGHSAAALQRSLQEDYPEEFPVTASALMSGPYSLSEEMKAQILGDDPYYFPIFLMNVLLSYNMVYGFYEDESAMFRPPYDSLARAFFAKQIEQRQLNQVLVQQLTAEWGDSYPRYMLQDSVFDQILTNPAHPLNQALLANDLFDWAPAAPTILIYCRGDDRVTYRNSIVADSVMNLRGASDVRSVDVNPELDHEECAPPAVLLSLLFFQPYFETVAVGTPGPALPLHPYPNPASDVFFLESLPAGSRLELFDAGGRCVHREILGSGRPAVSVGAMPSGFYLLRVTDGRTVYGGKLIKR